MNSNALESIDLGYTFHRYLQTKDGVREIHSKIDHVYKSPELSLNPKTLNCGLSDHDLIMIVNATRIMALYEPDAIDLKTSVHIVRVPVNDSKNVDVFPFFKPTAELIKANEEAGMLSCNFIITERMRGYGWKGENFVAGCGRLSLVKI